MKIAKRHKGVSLEFMGDNIFGLRMAAFIMFVKVKTAKLNKNSPLYSKRG